MPAPLITPDQMQCSIGDAQLRIAENWQRVRADVAAAAVAADREPDEVRIVGVSKYVDATITQWLVDAGCVDLGENRPQLLNEKAETLTGPITWHQIGHLQRNKVRRLLRAQPVIHSVDSERLLDEIHTEAIRQGRTIDVMVEINVSGEDAKTGLPMNQANEVIRRFVEGADGKAASDPSENAPGGRLVGLMAMAGWGTDSGQAQNQFSQLRRLRDELQSSLTVTIPELSMGMSGDFPSAISEGATMVRIGSSLFDGILP